MDEEGSRMVGCSTRTIYGETTMKFYLMLALIAAAVLAKPCAGQSTDSTLVTSVRMGAGYFQGMVTASAAKMDEGDYSFRPTPEVRTFAELIGHVADSNYDFCSIMTGEKRPGIRVGQTASTKSELASALAE